MGQTYRLIDNILTPTELSFYNVLRVLMGKNGTIQCKVRLGDIFEPTTREYQYRNKINQKHIDFLVCNIETMKPIIGVELDDPSHNRKDRQERDDFVDSVFKECCLPILHVKVSKEYDLKALTEEIKMALLSSEIKNFA